MNLKLRQQVDALSSADRETQSQAYQQLLAASEQPVDWAYEIWDEMVEALASPDARLRAIAAQLLCNLARWSDPGKRMLKDFPHLLAVTRDRKFVNARHTLQAIWKVGAAGEEQKQILLPALSERFASCVVEKDFFLIRYDIIADLKKLYDAVKDEKIRFLALKLIASEEDPKSHGIDLKLWKNRP